MSKDQKKPLAFPCSGEGDDMNFSAGMTLRDYFAAKAMDSLIRVRHIDLSSSDPDEFSGLKIIGNVGGTPDSIAEECYEMADAMLEARKL